MKDCVSSFEGYKKKFPQFEENIECVERYLSLYDWFTQNPNNRNIRNELYKLTINMIENAIDTRLKQEDIVTDQSNEHLNKLAKKYPDVVSIKDNKFEVDFSKYDKVSPKDKLLISQIGVVQKALPDVVKGDVKFLKEMLNDCKSDDTSDIECIETFVNASHVHGPYIPFGCKLLYPQFIRILSEEEDLPINVVGKYMAQETIDTLDCIRDRQS